MLRQTDTLTADLQRTTWILNCPKDKVWRVPHGHTEGREVRPSNLVYMRSKGRQYRLEHSRSLVYVTFCCQRAPGLCRALLQSLSTLLRVSGHRAFFSPCWHQGTSFSAGRGSLRRRNGPIGCQSLPPPACEGVENDRAKNDDPIQQLMEYESAWYVLAWLYPDVPPREHMSLQRLRDICP